MECIDPFDTRSGAEAEARADHHSVYPDFVRQWPDFVGRAEAPSPYAKRQTANDKAVQPNRYSAAEHAW
jgi:hypothetical protein